MRQPRHLPAAGRGDSVEGAASWCPMRCRSSSRPACALVRVDGGGGFAQLAFARGLPALVEAARAHGIAALALNNVVHFAALWPEVEALARRGWSRSPVTPSHAWVAPAGGTQPVFGTNPIAFGWPRPAGASVRVRLRDQRGGAR